MKSSFYRFFCKKNALTVAAEVLECESDAAALNKAKELLSASAYSSIDVRQGAAHLVGSVEMSSGQKHSNSEHD